MSKKKFFPSLYSIIKYNNLKDYEDHRETRVERMAFENFLRLLNAGRANNYEVIKPRRAKYFPKPRYPVVAAENQVDYVQLLYVIDQTLQKLSQNYDKGIDYTKKKPKKKKPIKYKSNQNQKPAYKSKKERKKSYKPSKAQVKENFYKQENYLKEKVYIETTPVEPYQVKSSKKSHVENKSYNSNDDYPQTTTTVKPYEYKNPAKEMYHLSTTTKSYEPTEPKEIYRLPSEHFKSEDEKKAYKQSGTLTMPPKEHYLQTTTAKPYALTEPQETYRLSSKTTSMPPKEYYLQTTTVYNDYAPLYKPSKFKNEIKTFKPSEIAFMPPLTTVKPYESASVQEVYVLPRSENDKNGYKSNEIKHLKDYYLPITTTRPYELDKKIYKQSEIASMLPAQLFETTTHYSKEEEDSDWLETDITDHYKPDFDESHVHEETDEYLNQFKKKYFHPRYGMNSVEWSKPLVAIGPSSHNHHQELDVDEKPVSVAVNNEPYSSQNNAYSSLYNKTQVENTAAIELFNRTFHPSHYKSVAGVEEERAKQPNHTAKLTSLRAVRKKHVGERRRDKLDQLFEKKIAQPEPIDSKDIYYMNLFIKLFKYINSTLEA